MQADALDREQLDALRRLTAEERYRASRDLYWTLRRHKAAFLRSLHPDWDDARLETEVAGYSCMPEPDLLELFVARLDEIGVSYLVTGSVAATLYGEPRATHDIDLVVDLSEAARDALPRVFPAAEFYLPPAEVVLLESEREGRGHFNIIHHASGLKADVYLVGDDELHAWAFPKARHYTVGKLEVRVAPPEYVIVRKLEFYREGGSPKHLRDISSMLRLSPELIDMPTLEGWVRRRGLDEAWAEVRVS